MNAEPAICLGPPVLAPAARISRHTTSGLWGRLSLPSIFYRHADSRDEALALCDCPVGDGTGEDTHRQLTYAETELAVRHIAARFDACGLKPGDIVALQLPPQIEAPIALLAALGLGFIVCPLPMAWRRMEIETALSRIGARAIVAWSDGDDCDRVTAACSAAFRVSSIRFVFAFGEQSVDGVTPLSIEIDDDAERLPRRSFPLSVDANALALITWDCACVNGPRAIARSHNECIAAGMSTVLAGSLGGGATLLSPYSLAGLSGIASTYIPWLMTGGLLALHRPFDLARWREQIAIYEPDFAPVPGALARRLASVAADAGAARSPLVAAVHEAGTPIPAVSGTMATVRSVDLVCLGEIALIAGNAGAAATNSENISLGSLLSGGDTGIALMELRCGVSTGANDRRRPLEVSGAPVPSAILATGMDGNGFRPAAADGDFVATGLYVEADEDAEHARIIGTADGIVHHGAASVSLAELDRLYASHEAIEDAAALAVSDAAMGSRLVAAIVAEPDAGPSLEDLAAHVHALGAADYKLPHRLIRLDSIPRGADGEVDRQALAALV